MRTRTSAATTLTVAASLAGALCAGCAGPDYRADPIYPFVPTKADAAGPNVPPVYVHVVGSDGTKLERADDDGWQSVCKTPCDGYVPALGTYRIAFPDDHSAPFTMPGSPGTRIVLKVDDDTTVWTRDADGLEVQRAHEAAWTPTLRPGWSLVLHLR
jgi:hypothetical protein